MQPRQAGPDASVRPPPRHLKHCRMAVPTGLCSTYGRMPWSIDLCTDYEGVDLHPFTRVALRHCQAPPSMPRAYYVYCDGSYQPDDPEASAWALTVVAKTTDGLFYNAGHLSGRVLDSTNLCIDPGRLDSTTAELVALGWACLLTAQLGCAAPVTIYTDSAVAIGVAKHSAPFKPQHDLARAVAIMYADVALHRRTLLEHSPGHVGHPWQELADVLAKRAARTATPPLPRLPRHHFQYHRDMEWQWLFSASEGAKAAYPPLSVDGLHYVLVPHRANTGATLLSTAPPAAAATSQLSSTAPSQTDRPCPRPPQPPHAACPFHKGGSRGGAGGRCVTTGDPLDRFAVCFRSGRYGVHTPPGAAILRWAGCMRRLRWTWAGADWLRRGWAAELGRGGCGVWEGSGEQCNARAGSVRHKHVAQAVDREGRVRCPGAFGSSEEPLPLHVPVVLEVVPWQAWKRRCRSAGCSLGHDIRKLLPRMADVSRRMLKQSTAVERDVGEHDCHGAGQVVLRPEGGRVLGHADGDRTISVDRDRSGVAQLGSQEAGPPQRDELSSGGVKSVRVDAQVGAVEDAA